ncbi:MAG: hypothetical protein Q9160_006512 [Pyrenula sp. 1 TL-2023]
MRPLLYLPLLAPLTLADTIRGEWFFSAYSSADNPPPFSAFMTSAQINTNDPAVLPPPGVTTPPKCFQLPTTAAKPFARSILNIAGDTMLCSVVDQLVTFPSPDCTGAAEPGDEFVVEVKKEDGKSKGLSAVMAKPGGQGWRSFSVKKCPPRPVEQPEVTKRLMRRGLRMVGL